MFMKHDLAESEAKLKMALNVDPDDPQTKLNLALIYSNTGRKQQAIDLYHEVAESAQAPAEWKEQARARLQELQQ